MISFLLATLGSVIFWVVYALITLVMGLAIMRKFAPDTFESITTGEKQGFAIDWGMYSALAAFFFIFWPVILVAIAVALIIKHLWILIFFKALGPIFLRLFRFIAKITPDVKISID